MELGRRQALKLLGAAGTLLAFGGVLAACGGEATSSVSSSGSAAGAYTPPATWDEMLAAAKAEGKVVVAASPDPETRQRLPAAFTQRFGIQVEYLAGATEVTARLQTERAAGQYTLDVEVNGSDSVYGTLYANKWLDPLKSSLLLPEVTDGSKWKAGAPWFRDPNGDTALQILSTISNNVMINADLLSPNDFPNADALLDPKWKGKICTFDPSANGGGLAVGAALYIAKGEDYVTKLYKGQQAVLSRDYQQVADWLARGAYPVGVAVPKTYLDPYVKAGVKVAPLDLPDAPNSLGGGFGIVVVMNKAPHPNAARVFANWIASKEGQTLYSQTQLQAPVRNDIEATWVPPELVPKPGAKYLDTYEYKFVTGQRLQIREFYGKMLK